MLTVLDLFSGIGGFSLGLERTGGFRTVAFCEIGPFCLRVLAKHWPEVLCYDDICSLTAGRLRADRAYPDFICGGFPCQDISGAGAVSRRAFGDNLDGARSGLWSELARLVAEIRPLGVLIENVPRLVRNGLARLLRFFAGIGYDAEWRRLSAREFGAHHLRQRLWLLAYPRGSRMEGSLSGLDPCLARSLGWCGEAAGEPFPALWSDRPADHRWALAGLRRTDDGLPDAVDRVAALGNAVLPIVPQAIGNAILASLPTPQPLADPRPGRGDPDPDTSSRSASR